MSSQSRANVKSTRRRLAIQQAASAGAHGRARSLGSAEAGDPQDNSRRRTEDV
jgi:hypothetical protein